MSDIGSDLEWMYLPAAVLNLLTGAFCVVVWLLCDLPVVAAIGVSVNLVALAVLVIVGEPL